MSFSIGAWCEPVIHNGVRTWGFDQGPGLSWSISFRKRLKAEWRYLHSVWFGNTTTTACYVPHYTLQDPINMCILGKSWTVTHSFPWVAKFQVPLDLSTILGGWDAALALRNLGCRSEVGARIGSGGQASNKDVRSYYLGVFGRTISVTYPKFDGFSMLILFFCSKITILVVDSIFRHVFLLSGTTPTWHNQWTSGDDQWKTTKAQKHERTHSIW